VITAKGACADASPVAAMTKADANNIWRVMFLMLIIAAIAF
jgi:hypothetical protein